MQDLEHLFSTEGSLFVTTNQLDWKLGTSRVHYDFLQRSLRWTSDAEVARSIREIGRIPRCSLAKTRPNELPEQAFIHIEKALLSPKFLNK